jgi:hypothetical protein
VGAIIAVPLLLFLDLGRLPGTFELGDADFPFRPYPITTFLPWNPTSFLGFDNTFTAIPRAAYLLLMNASLSVVRSPQLAQYVVYIAIGIIGVSGAYRLARDLGSGRVASLAIATLFAFNPWSSDRIGQTSLIMAFMATPWLLWALRRTIVRPSAVAYAAAALSSVVVIGSLQMTYLFVMTAVVFGVVWLAEAMLTGERSVRPLLRMVPFGVAAFLACAFFVFPALADVLHGSAGAVQNVSHRYEYGIFSGYGVRENLPDALRLIGFYYSPYRNASPLWLALLWLFPVVLLLAAVLVVRRGSRAWVTPLAALATMVLAAVITIGSHNLPALVRPLWYAIPGMRGLVDPDYFLGIYLLAAVVLLASVRTSARYTALLAVCAVVLAVPYFPGEPLVLSVPYSPGDPLFAKVTIPRAYADIPDYLTAPGRLLWLPERWVSRYSWSPYLVSGLDAVTTGLYPTFGPGTVEIEPEGVAELATAFSSALLSENAADFSWLARKTQTRFVLFSDDIVTDPLVPYDPLSTAPVLGALRDFVSQGSLMAYSGLDLDATDPRAVLANDGSWALRYDGPGGPGNVRVGATLLPLRDLRASAARFADPSSVGLEPLRILSTRAPIVRVGGLARASASWQTQSGVTVVSVQLPIDYDGAPPQLIAGLTVTPFAQRRPGEWEASVESRRPQSVQFVLQGASLELSGPSLPVAISTWPSGALALRHTLAPSAHRAPVAVNTAPDYDLFRVPGQQTGPVDVSSRTVTSTATVAALPALSQVNGDADVIAPAIAQPVDAWALRAPDATSARIPAGSWKVGYGGSPDGAAVLGGVRVSVQALIHSAAFNGGDVRLLPLSSGLERFDARGWKSERCSNVPTKIRGSYIMVIDHDLVGRSYDDSLCSSKLIALRRGRNHVLVREGWRAMAARGLLVVDAAAIRMENRSLALAEAPTHDAIEVWVDVAADTTARLYLYVDPGAGQVTYRDVEVTAWPTGTVVVGPRRLDRVARSVRVERAGYLETDVEVGPAATSAVLIGNWSYAPTWEAWSAGRRLPHRLVNGFANAWLLGPSATPMRIEIRMAAATPFYAGVIVSALTCLAAVLALVVPLLSASIGRRRP